MTPPVRTPEQRSAALERSLQVRRERADLRADLKAGRIDAVALVTEAVRSTQWSQLRVRWLLESLPGIGPARAAGLLEACDIAPSRRLGGLSPRQREALVGVLAERPS